MVLPEASSKTHEALTPYQLDAVIVLGANIRKDPHSGKFIFNGIIPGLDPDLKSFGARSRGLAASMVLETRLAPLLLITGGQQLEEDGKISSKAELLTEYIQKKYHVPNQNIRAIGRIGNTQGNVQDAALFIAHNQDLFRQGKIGILTNKFHMERAMAFFYGNPFFAQSEMYLKPIVAEDLIAQKSERHAHWVKSLMVNPHFDEVRMREKQGLEDLKRGAYHPTHS